jgi:NADH:ubiquinone oxidoreductase subunit
VGGGRFTPNILWIVAPGARVPPRRRARFAPAPALWHHSPLLDASKDLAMAFLDAVFIRLTSRRVGQDRFGNTYWEATSKRDVQGRPIRRVLYAGAPEASSVPPEWWGWIHHTTAAPLPEDAPRRAWQKEHRPNLTGTPQAWRPPGHDARGGQRPATAGDYEAWTPGR